MKTDLQISGYTAAEGAAVPIFTTNSRIGSHVNTSYPQRQEKDYKTRSARHLLGIGPTLSKLIVELPHQAAAHFCGCSSSPIGPSRFSTGRKTIKDSAGLLESKVSKRNSGLTERKDDEESDVLHTRERSKGPEGNRTESQGPSIRSYPSDC